MAVRIGALLFFADVGFAISIPTTLAHLARTGELPMTPFGFRAFSGPFEQLGPTAFTALGWTLVAVSVIDAVAGAWLWQGRRRGATLGLAAAPVSLALSVGFALPFLIVPVAARTAIVAAYRRALQ